jgi:hypothetical protein
MSSVKSNKKTTPSKQHQATAKETMKKKLLWLMKKKRKV